MNVCRHGQGNERHTLLLDNETTVLSVLSAGASTTYAEIDCTSILPPTVIAVRLRCYAATKDKDAYFRPKGITTDVMILDGDAIGYRELVTDAAQIIEYKVITGGTADVSIIAYDEEI